MGVHGLWRLLDSFGQVTQPENWRGRRVAIDASIWVAQLRAQTRPGSDADQHLLEGFLVRILKLIFYDIHPIFVFDGPATSAKSAEHRRRQMRRNAMSQVYLKRHAQQIMMAQISAGTLNVTELSMRTDVKSDLQSTKPGEVASPCSDEETATPVKQEGDDGDSKDLVSMATTKQGNPSLVRDCRRGVQKKRRLAPERVSKKITHLFLHDAGDLIALRKKGEQQLFENSLRNTSSSLFMGPRRVFLGEGETLAEPVVCKKAVVDVEREENAVDVDGYDNDERQEDVVSTGAMTIPSSEISVHDSASCDNGGSAERCEEVEVMRLSGTPRSREGSTTDTTCRVSSYLQNFVTPPVKRARNGSCDDGESLPSAQHIDESSSNAESGRVLGTDSGASVGSSSNLSDGDEGEEDDLEWGTESDLNADGNGEDFLWHPNTQIGPPSEYPIERTQPPAPTEAPPRVPEMNSDFARATAGARKDDAPSLASDSVNMRFPIPQAAFPAAQRGPPAAEAGRFSNINAHSRPIPFELLGLVELLDCCGIPYVLSPAEADAQCALLAREGLVDAVFTEDSDVVVHGAPIVLRGFFASNKHVVEYDCGSLVTCGVDKNVLVCLAYLLGCDYTEGVGGMGLVGALDAVVASWPSPAAQHTKGGGEEEEMEEEEDPGVSFVCHLLKRWHRLCADQPVSWMDCDAGDGLSLLQYSVFAAHRRAWGTCSLPSGFPDQEVARSFFSPKVDGDTTPFAVTSPDWQRMRAFAGGHGLLASSWVMQRFELSQKKWTTRQAELEATINSLDKDGRRQRHLDDYGVKTHISEKWAYKKQPPQQATALARLRAVKQASNGE